MCEKAVNRSIKMLEKDYVKLRSHLFCDGKEQAAFLLCRLSNSPSERSFLVNRIIPVAQEDIIYNDDQRVHYQYTSYLPVIKHAYMNDMCFFVVHSHIDTITSFSALDDSEERKLLKFAYNRIGRLTHGSMVFSNAITFDARIYDPADDSFHPVGRLIIIGESLHIINSVHTKEASFEHEVFSRNILAFGEPMQALFRSMNIGVVGCGGTGSAVIEELCRLGIGQIIVVDHQDIELSNITRMHGSSVRSVGQPKVNQMKSMALDIGMGTTIVALNEKLNNASTASKLKTCDVIFSCLDNTHFARAILNQLTIYYGIPLIDRGIKFDTRNTIINDVLGRIDIVTPNTSCLLCRNVIDLRLVASENDISYEQHVREGYAKEIQDDKIQIIPYNTLIASYAVIAMIQMITNFKGKTEYHTVYRFNKDKVTYESIKGDKVDEDCLCSKNVFCGDVEPFLGLCW